MKYKELYLDLTELCKDLAIENEQLKSQLSSTDKVIASGEAKVNLHNYRSWIGDKEVDDISEDLTEEIDNERGNHCDLILRKRGKQ